MHKISEEFPVAKDYIAMGLQQRCVGIVMIKQGITALT